jgi:hypothetical protein
LKNELVSAKRHADARRAGAQLGELRDEAVIGTDQALRRRQRAATVAAVVVLRQQRDPPAARPGAKRDRPAADIVGIAGPSQHHPWSAREDRAAERLPALLAVGKCPGRKVVVAVEVRLIADLEAVEALAERPRGVGRFRRRRCRRRGGEVHPVEHLPAAAVQESGERIDVGGRHLACGVAGTVRLPLGPVDGVAADAQQARPETAEQADQRRVARHEARHGERALLVGEPGEGRADAAGRALRD